MPPRLSLAHHILSISAMKLHLPARLFCALISLCAVLSVCSGTLAYAEDVSLLPLNGDSYSNGSVTYSNHQIEAFSWTDYEAVAFRNCKGTTTNSSSSSSVAYGGAVYNGGSTVILNNNGAIDFCDNRAGVYRRSESYYDGYYYGYGSYSYRYYNYSHGGAIYNSGNFHVNGNENICFQNNATYGTVSPSIYDSYYYYYGGAICNENTFSLNDNGNVFFGGNASSEKGGAIYNTGTFSLSGNDDVVFRQNWEGGNKRLRSIYHEGGSMSLDASAGHSITFYDSIYSASGTTLKLNETGTGDIIFTGETTEEDLRLMKGEEGTATEIQNSRTSQLSGKISLGGGRLIIRDEARLSASSNISLGEGASICLYNGQFGAGSSYTQTFGSGTTLNIVESGTIYNKVSLQSGSTMLLDKAQAAFNASLTMGDGMTLILKGYQKGETYTLLTASSLSVNPDNIHIIGNRGTVSAVGNSLVFESDYERLQWSGSGYWSDDSSKLWTSVETGEQMTFASGDEVVFNNGGTVNISGEVRPSAIEVSGTRAVTFRGEGGIIGLARLTKEGGNTLTINTANSYSGGTTINGGTVKVGHADALGSGEVALGNGATLDMAGHAIANELHLVGNSVVKNGSSFAGALVLESGTLSGDALQIAQQATVESGTIQNTLTGTGSLHKTTEGAVLLNGDNGYSGGTVVEAGTLVLGHLNALGSGDVKLAGGTLDLNQLEGSFCNRIIGTGGLTLDTQNHLSLAGDSSYSGGTILKNGTVTLLHEHALGTGVVELAGGTLDLNARDISLDNAVAGTGSLVVESEHSVTLNGNNSYSGGTTLNKGTLIAGNATAFGTAAVTVNGGTLDVNGQAMANAVVLNGGTLQGAEALTGNITAKNVTLTLQHDHALGSGRVELVGDMLVLTAQDIALGNVLTGTGTLVVESEHSLTLTGDNTYSGSTTLNKGTLTAGSATAFGTAAVTVNGGTLDVNGLAAANAVVLNGGTLQGAEALTGAITVTGNAALDTELNTSLLLESGTLSGTAIGNKSRVTAVGGELACDLVGRAALKVTGDTVFNGHATHTGGTTVESGSLTVTGTIDTDISVMGGALVVDTMELADGQAVSLEGGNISGKMVLGDNTYLSVWDDAVIDGDVTVRDGIVENDDCDLRITGTLALESGYTEIGGSLHTGTLTIAEGAKLVHGSEGQITVTAVEDAIAVLSGVSMEENMIHGTSAEERGKVDGAQIELAEGIDFSLRHLVLGATTRITDDPATAKLDDVTAELVMGVNTSLTGSDMLMAGTTLEQSGNPGVTLTLSDDSSVLMLEATTFDSLTLSGSTLVLELAGMTLEMFDNAELIAVSFTSGKGYATFDKSLAVTLSVDGINYERGYTMESDDTPTTMYFRGGKKPAATPEPATATLSLLSLAALAARRKRK